MASAALTREEGLGLGVAVVLHVALVAVLLLQPDPVHPPAMPERMTVSLAEDVGPVAEAPEPVPESREAIAPTISDQPAPVPAIEPPKPVEVQRPVERPQPRPTTSTRRVTAPPKTPAKAPAKTPPAPARKSGGSRIGSDFLAGAGSSTTTEETRIPASQIGASAKASIIQAIIRQIKPHWSAPQGADADLLVTVLSFRLKEDGSLDGRPRVISQSGVTQTNAPQKDLHAERAIRAVQLAAPFDLPPEYYNAWKSIDGAKFDRNLSR